MQMLSRRLALGVGFLLTGSAVAYVPFAGVEELNPKPLGQFCDPEVKSGIRLCQGTSHRVLEDGGRVGLKWAMHIDPDRVLSLDLEQKHGVRLVKCTPSSLEIVLPESHERHLEVGSLIVGSHFVHGCEHLLQVADPDKIGDEPANLNLYHRVIKVSSLSWKNHDGSLAAGSHKGKMAYAKVWTRELPSLGHAGPMTYEFDYTPVEAEDESEFPQRRTCDSEYCNGKWRDLGARRMNAQNGIPETFNANEFTAPSDNYHGYNNPNRDVKYRVDGGHPTFGGQTVTSDDVQSLLNFQPKKVANFGWNWNFKLNASQDLSFNYTVPGSKMYVMIKKPYIKAHAKFRIKFRSYMPNENAEDTFFTDNTWVSLKNHRSADEASVFEQWEPRVKWEASLKGHAAVKVGIRAQMRAAMNVNTNPLELVQIPVLQQFWQPKWFGTLDFTMGSLPVSVTPGIQFKAKFFHYGTFRGSMAVGVQSHPKFDPKLQFDSFTGLRVDLNTKLKETTLTPPNWMVSTSHFECGIALEPTIWIKGHLGKSVHNTRFAAALRPYFNMTITRAGHVDMPGDFQKELIIYPFRIVGLNVDTRKRYKVRVTTSMPKEHCSTNQFLGADGMSHYQNQKQMGYTPYGGNSNLRPSCEQFSKRIESSEGLNWGEVEFHDPVNRFSFGLIAQRMLLYLDIQVQLVEVDYSSGKPFERVSEKQGITCRTIINGVCQPSPIIKEFWFGSTSGKVKLYVHAIWKENPRPWFATRIRGVAASFPEVIINKDYIARVDPGFDINSYVNTGVVSGKNANKPLVLVLQHAFKSYPILINKHNGYVPGMNSSSMTSDQIVELGASFLSTWERSCVSSTHGCDPKLVLYHGDVELAEADLPPIKWDSRQGMQGTMQQIFGSEWKKSSRIVPVSVALKPKYSGSTAASMSFSHVGLVRMKVAIAPPANWNRWISPYEFTPVQLGAAFKLAWTLADADPFKATTFSLMVFKCTSQSNVAATGTTATGDQQQYLHPRIGNSWCQQLSTEPALPITPRDAAEGEIHSNRFEHDIQLNGMAVGDTIMVAVQWIDSYENTHTMYAPPFLIQGQQAVAAAATAVAAAPGAAATQAPVVPAASPLVESVTLAPQVLPGEAPATTTLAATVAPPRKLNWLANMFGNNNYGWKKGADGQWKHSYDGDNFNGNHECKKKDLNFAFGAGIMFRAYVKRLSLPKDLPILGAIQNAPQLGMPWQSITDWMSHPTDLASKLPALFCRHGVCAATLPGCPAYNSQRHYYPEVTIQFKHTLRYPRTGSMNASQVQWVTALKTALSYTFAVMPEVIQIIVHYTNSTTPTGTYNPASAHRRRYQQYHNVMTGDDACENRGYTMAQCAQVGCCQWESTMSQCHSAVGTGPCYKNGAVAAPVAAAATAGVAAVAAAPAGVAPPVAAVTAAPVPAVPQPALPNAGLPPTPAPATAATNTLAPGPVIAPLTGRRLEDEDEDEDDEDERRVERVEIHFKNGLHYEMDHLLMNAMMKEGLFDELESVPADKPVRIHSYEIRNNKWPSDLSEKDSLPAGIAGVAQPQAVLALFALAGCALIGVAFVVRRARASYERVEDNSLGPVE